MIQIQNLAWTTMNVNVTRKNGEYKKDITEQPRLHLIQTHKHDCTELFVKRILNQWITQPAIHLLDFKIVRSYEGQPMNKT